MVPVHIWLNVLLFLPARVPDVPLPFYIPKTTILSTALLASASLFSSSIRWRERHFRISSLSGCTVLSTEVASPQSITEVKLFFSVVQQVYVFFGHSISRWKILSNITSESEVTLKSLNPTRWSAGTNSLIAVRLRLSDLLQALTEVILISSKRDTINEATSLKKRIETFDFFIMLTFLADVLSLTNTASLLLQSKRTNLSQAVNMLSGITDSLKEYRRNFEGLVKKAKDLAEKLAISPHIAESRKVTSKFDDARMEKEHVFKVVVFNGVIDTLIAQIDERFKGTRKIASVFGIFSPATLLELESSHSHMESEVNFTQRISPPSLRLS